MKILWVSNTCIPQAAELVGTAADVGGGWVAGLAQTLLQTEHMLISCWPVGTKTPLVTASKDNFTCYNFPRHLVRRERYLPNTERRFAEIFQKEQPQIIHIFGTEYPHTLAAVNAAQRVGMLSRVCVSVQGLIGACAEVYNAGLPNTALHKYTLRDFVTRNNLFQQQREFAARGELETRALQKVKHVIGRTAWDKAYVRACNPNAVYYACNETLRDAFYSGVWQYKNCLPYSIFTSQCGYPLKGFHFLLQAMPQVLKVYPQAHLYTTGPNLTALTPLQKLTGSYYAVYLAKQIKELGLSGHITFLGGLSALQMKEQYLKSNVFVSPSSIENSPNSVGEAMLLGMPVVASSVGGTNSVFTPNEDGLGYAFQDTQALAQAIITLFADSARAAEMGQHARLHAQQTHDAKKNLADILSVYRDICGA
ncbi:MAG: glycosyltransferase family 4 protein [Oscillospiraceae bacterium]|nr:glycosyltransferase family 4 protein [Oscillospiraceae bacterium]